MCTHSQAEEREREESKRLRERERGEVNEKRRSEQLQRHRLAAEMEEKQLRLGHLTWLEAHTHRAAFLVTRAAPQLYFLPAVLCASTEAALAARKEECEAEAQQAADRLSAALTRVAEAAASRESELGVERGAVAEADDATGEPPSSDARPVVEEAEEADDVGAADDDPLAGVLGVQDA